MRCIVGVDVGTSSSKGVLVAEDGTIVATSTVGHIVDRPRPGWVEMDAQVWWDEFVAIARDLLAQAAGASAPVQVVGVGVSGMGPCVLLADETGRPVRPAILYGVDTRAMAQVERMTSELGMDALTGVGGSVLTSQAAGPKILWVAEEEPDAYRRACRLFMPASWLAYNLTGEYALDHQSASQTSPLYRIDDGVWHEAWWDAYAPGIERPALRWAADVVGTVTPRAEQETGIPAGTPVITGTIDAWSEAVSAGADRVGDLMLMYGTTMFLIATQEHTLRSPSMWTTVGARLGTRNLAGGLATSGALAGWVADLAGAGHPELIEEAFGAGLGAGGLVMLPYFAGERTPILDPDARGVVAGLTLSHTRGHLYRAALEATAFGVRHNVETLRAAGADIQRVVAVGGGTRGALWPQIVSDVTGLPQHLPTITIGASYGAAFLAATAVADSGAEPDIAGWNPISVTIQPRPAAAAQYEGLYALYHDLYSGTAGVVHALAGRQRTEGDAQ